MPPVRIRYKYLPEIISAHQLHYLLYACLLYTSDAADE